MRLLLAARLSQLQKDGQEGLGLDVQDKSARKWAERNGYEIVATAADTKSGAGAPWDRKNLKPWVTDPAKMATYDGILAVMNDRLSRGGWADEARIRMWAEDNRKQLVIVDGPVWPPRNDGDRWQWEAMSMQARREWENTRDRTMAAVGSLRDAGKLTSKPPFGYTSDGPKYDRRLVIDWGLTFPDPDDPDLRALIRLFLANHGVWESGWWLGPTVSVAHKPQDVEAYLDAIGDFTQAVA